MLDLGEGAQARHGQWWAWVPSEPMQLVDGRPVYSATDLVGFLACGHLTDLERSALAGLTDRRHRGDPELDAIAERGRQHEQRYLEALRAAGRMVVDLDVGEHPRDRGERYRLLAERTRRRISDEVFRRMRLDEHLQTATQAPAVIAA